jgi:hypothetical protein
MQRRRVVRNTVSLAAGIACVALAATAPGATSERGGRSLEYERREPPARREAAAPPRRAVPRPLRLDPAAEPPVVRTARPRGERTPSDAARLSSEEQIRRSARLAALWTAERMVELHGRREYFRVGFHDGMRTALDDRSLGERDEREGARRGWHDGRARQRGAEIGAADAAERARERSRAQIVEQFADLAHEPVYLPRAGDPPYAPLLPEVAQPTLRGVVDDHSLTRFDLEAGVPRGWLGDWGFDAEALVGCDGYQAFYDDAWTDPTLALEWWVGRADRSQAGAIPPSDGGRALFREVFASSFRARLAELYPSRLLRSFELGLAEGWAYGALIRAELRYREGFRRGYLEAVEDEARAVFHATYPGRYERDYRQAFDEWSRTARPQLGQLWLVDGDDDGVFQPGEEMLLGLELINLGGAAGQVTVRLEGTALEAAVERQVELERRSVRRVARPLIATISPHEPGRSRSELRVTVGESAIGLPLRVSHPLQLRRGSWRIVRRNLDGEAELEVEVENESRRAVAATVRLTTAARPGFELVQDLGAVEAGELRRLVLEVGELDPLELLAGRVSFEVAVHAGDGRQDRFVYHLPDAARDLANRDLLLYMVRSAAAGVRQADERVATIRQLVITRLREDWRVAVAGSGNPYRFDYRNGAGSTALGDLVQTVEGLPPSALDHAVFAGLSGDVLALADQLPGLHPFLRRYVRKLARELP